MRAAWRWGYVLIAGRHVATAVCTNVILHPLNNEQFKTLLGGAQVLGSFKNAFPALEWPRKFLQLLGWMNVVNFDVSTALGGRCSLSSSTHVLFGVAVGQWFVFISSHCVWRRNFYDDLLIMTLTPLLVLAIIFVVYYVKWCVAASPSTPCVIRFVQSLLHLPLRHAGSVPKLPKPQLATATRLTRTPCSVGVTATCCTQPSLFTHPCLRKSSQRFRWVEPRVAVCAAACVPAECSLRFGVTVHHF